MKYRFAAALLFGGVMSMGAGAAFAAPCEQQLDELEARLDKAAEQSISTSTAGQGVAGSREAQAMEKEEVEEPVVPYQAEDKEAAAIERAEEAGEGGDLILQARSKLEEARAAAENGDETACKEAHDAAAALLQDDRTQDQ